MLLPQTIDTSLYNASNPMRGVGRHIISVKLGNDRLYKSQKLIPVYQRKASHNECCTIEKSTHSVVTLVEFNQNRSPLKSENLCPTPQRLSTPHKDQLIFIRSRLLINDMFIFQTPCSININDCLFSSPHINVWLIIPHVLMKTNRCKQWLP